MKDFIPNQEYVQLLRKNSDLSKNKNAYDTTEYQQVKKRLTEIEVAMSSQEIIKHAKYTFPFVGEPQY